MTEAPKQKPTITDYNDYRDFLKDRFDYEKSRKKTFSFQYCATRLGASKAYLKLVIEKKRHTSMSKLSLIGALFKLDTFEQQFFTILFLKTTSPDAKLTEYFEGALNLLRHRLKYVGTHEGHQSSDDKEVVFKSWLYMAIHSLARVEGFKPEVSWVQSRLTGENASAAEIKGALDELLANGSIQQKDGLWQPDEFVFRTPTDFDGDQFKIYKVGTHRTDEALNAVPQHRPSHYHMMSICLNEADQGEVRRLYVEFRDKIIAISKASKKPDQVFFLSNNIFCVAKEPPVTA